MKHFLTLIFFAIALSAIGQIDATEIKKDDFVTVGKVNYSPLVRLAEIVKHKDYESYSLIYYDFEYPTLKNYESLTIKNKETLDDFYNLLKMVAENNTEYTFVLEDTRVSIAWIGRKVHVIIKPKSGIKSRFEINKNQIDKLFGKA